MRRGKISLEKSREQRRQIITSSISGRLVEVFLVPDRQELQTLSAKRLNMNNLEVSLLISVSVHYTASRMTLPLLGTYPMPR